MKFSSLRLRLAFPAVLLLSAALAVALVSFLNGPGCRGGSGEAPVGPGEDLEDQAQVARARAEAKARVTGEVLAGRLTLLEAAGLSQALDQGLSATLKGVFRRTYPAETEEESYCRAVIAHARAREGPNQFLADRLEAELLGLLRRGCVPRLSRPPESGSP